MNGWKYLALSTVMALGMSAGLAGCPEDDAEELCGDIEDCSSGLCEETCGVCYEPCETNADCDATAGETCELVCDAGTGKRCTAPSGGGGDGGGGGEGGMGGEGGSECEDHEDCVEVAGYCSVEDTCVSNECGTQGVNDCAQCAKGPDSGARGEDGPVVYAPEQRDLDAGDGAVNCRKSDACGAANHVCGFSASYYAAPGQTISSSGAYLNKIFLVLNSSTTCTSDGQCGGAGGLCRAGVCVSRTFENVSLSGGTVSWEGCYDAQMQNIGGVLLLLDDDGNYSNALCFSGTTP